MRYGSAQRPWDPRPLLFGACFAMCVLLPFALGPLGAQRGKVFAGTLKALGDENEYLSAIHQGGPGNWLWHNPFMVHPPAPMVMYLPYLACGHVEGRA